MKIKLSYLLFLTAFLSFAQNKFEPGYYIDNSGIKTECLIKNYDWENNPIEIETKKTIEEIITLTKSIDQIKEFGINNKSKFVKATVKIDESSPNPITLTNGPSPKFIEKTVLLKVLVEGKSNLYYFESEDYDRFFYSVNDKIEQLVYKQYNNSEGNISTNDAFKQQLFVNFKCNNDQKSIIALKYNNNDLVDYFIKTNNCISGNTDAKAISEKKKFEINFNLKLNLILNKIKTNYTIDNGGYIDGNYSTNKDVLSYGLETEIIFPYYSKNWSLVFDPEYLQNKESINIYKPKYLKPNFILHNNSYVVKIPIGIRRYFMLNKNSKIYSNFSLCMNYSGINTTQYNEFSNETITIYQGEYPSFSFAFGLGYSYKNYSAEIKFNTKTTNYSDLNNTLLIYMNQLSLKLGYKLF